MPSGPYNDGWTEAAAPPPAVSRPRIPEPISPMKVAKKIPREGTNAVGSLGGGNLKKRDHLQWRSGRKNLPLLKSTA